MLSTPPLALNSPFLVDEESITHMAEAQVSRLSEEWRDILDRSLTSEVRAANTKGDAKRAQDAT